MNDGEAGGTRSPERIDLAIVVGCNAVLWAAGGLLLLMY